MWVTLSLLSLIIAAVCWIIGDALIVGFAKPDPALHGDFIEYMGDDAYAYQLNGSEQRLRWGALVANYSIPFMLLGLYAHGFLVRDSIIGITGVVVMGVGMSLSPLAHATFYYLGITSQRTYREFSEGADAAASADQARATYRMLSWAWMPAVGLTFGGGILFAIPLALGSTALPWWAVFFTPIVLALPASQIKKLPYPGKPLLDGALFNIVMLGWAVAFLVLSRVYAPL